MVSKTLTTRSKPHTLKSGHEITNPNFDARNFIYISHIGNFEFGFVFKRSLFNENAFRTSACMYDAPFDFLFSSQRETNECVPTTDAL